MHARTRRHAAAATLTAASVVATLTLGAPATADPNNNSSKKLQKAVTLDGVMQHLEEFQAIADANGGTRAAGTPGYDASAEYVHDQLAAAGYDVEYQEFLFPFFQELSDAEFEEVSPEAEQFTVNEDFATMTFSGSGDVTATVQGVDLNLGTEGSTSGCELSDFEGFEAGSIALIRRGTCPFGLKAMNAEAAGATAVIIFNTEPGSPAFAGTLGAPVGIPVIGTSYAIGLDLNDPSTTTARVRTDTVSEERTTRNVIAQTTEGRTDNVVMAGAHLDSVAEGPGINDNGTGSAAILETALQMKKVKPNNQVRFAWWSAEELGLIGSTYYVNNLSEAEREDIALYLNFDMVGSPNYMRGVYDGDNSVLGNGDDDVVRPEGSVQIEAVFNEHFASEGLDFQDTQFSGRSDYQAFINNGIPSGGLFTGAEGLKTAEEAALYGGVAGEQYDPCYHEVCDSFTPVADGATDATYTVNADELIGNVNTVALDTNADAIAHSVITYAFDTSDVNGETSPGKSHGKAKRDPGKPDAEGRMAS